MTAATEIIRRDPTSFGNRPAAVSQATAIEQSRAIAEVQAQVVVAQSCPRDMASAEAEMKLVCGRMTMAESAFYQVTNRGSGPSVHLARELARIWGNLDYGVKELHRSDERGESEVLAFAWDQQRNTRSSRSFIVPHQRMKQGARVDLVDLQDIYLNNQNVGARAVRETIFTILPRWFVEMAMDLCRQTLEHGEGKPLGERIATVIKAFKDNIGVTEAQLERRLEKKRGQWDAGDIAQLTIIGSSIKRGEIKVDEEFPPAESTTTDEIAKPATKEGDPDNPPEKRARTRKSASASKPAEKEQSDESASKPTNDAQQQETRARTGDEQKAHTEVGGNPTAGPDAGTEQPKSGMRKALEKRLFALFKDTEISDRDDRITIYRSILKRPDVGSTNDLSDVEVTTVGDKLYGWQQEQKLDQEVTEILNIAALEAENRQQQEDQS